MLKDDNQLGNAIRIPKKSGRHETMSDDVKKTKTPDQPAMTAKSPNGDATGPDAAEQGERRNFFDVIADFFKTMTIGVIKFAFVKLPKAIWDFIVGTDWRKVLKRIYSMWRAIMWCSIWLFVIFAGWIAFALEKFLSFWRWVGNWILDVLLAFWTLIMDNAGPIWFVIAIIGSVYGLLYVTLKRRARRKNIPFHGVFGFLRRKKAQKSAPEENGNAK